MMTSDESLNVRTVSEAVLVVDIALCTEIHKEDDHDGGEDYSWNPRIDCPVTSHADACIGTNLAISRVEEMNKSRSNDDSSTEVSSKEIHIDIDSEPANTSREYREESSRC
jgi:hypothetical protein